MPHKESQTQASQTPGAPKEKLEETCKTLLCVQKRTDLAEGWSGERSFLNIA
ncbi:hypothetical protein [Desulfitobacterium hafniense]|uniref:hypothetical protein n=1 Tax=Desulfitobacterium hafniense TaxID=49338 RepID=UPI0002EB5750|nr:hypothetical protein [Desulfitobacterium hafniense]MEA5025643.1 hypothetical protein [Desulfitobacterium hafniense]